MWPNAQILDPPVPAASLKPLIEPASTALLIIDAQVDFIAPQGAMAHAGSDLSRVEPALERIERLIACARATGVTIAFARVVTRPQTDSDALKQLLQRKGYPEAAAAICRAGTAGAGYYRVRPQPGDIEISKTLFSSFVGTELDAELRGRNLDTLVVAGFTTDCCVDCTVRDAFHRNYHVFVVADGCAAYAPELHMGTLAALGKNCALLVETQAVLQSWS